MAEKTGEGVQPTGQKPDAAAKRPNLRESDPQAYEVFLDELRELCAIPPHVGKTLEEVVSHFEKQVRDHEKTAPGRAEDIQDPSKTNAELWVGDLLEKILECDRADIDKVHGSWFAAMAHAMERIRGWKEGIQQPGAPPPVMVPALPPQGQPNPIGVFLDQLIASTDMNTPSAFDILKVCMELAVFLIDKNRKYGDSAVDPVRIMSSVDPIEQIKVRMDDKLSRLYRGHMGGEDAMQDLVGYWVLLRVAEKRAKTRRV